MPDGARVVPEAVAVNDRQLKQTAFNMQNAFTFRSYSGRFTGAMLCAFGDPASGNVHAGIGVSVAFAAGCTGEHVAAPDSQFSTFGAGLRSVGWLDVFVLQSSTLGFVGAERLQLAVRPTGHHPVGVLVEDLASVSNTCKPFHADRSALCAFGFGNDSFTQIVVFPGDAAALPSRLSSQRLTGAASVSRLQGCPDLVTLRPVLLPHRATVQCAVRRGGRVANPQVHAHRWTLAFAAGRDFAGSEKIPLASDQGEIALSLLRRQQTALMVSAGKRNIHSTAPCPDRHGRSRIGKDAAVVSSGSMRLERTLDLLIQFVSIGHFRNRTHSGLGSQPELLSDLPVAKSMQIELAKSPRLPSNPADVIAGGVRYFERAAQSVRLLGRTQQFNLGRQLQLLAFRAVALMARARTTNLMAPFLQGDGFLGQLL